MEIVKKGMLSGRQAADYLNISDNTFMKAVEGGYIVPQIELKRPPGRIERGFVVQYLETIKKIIPRKRVQRLSVFTPPIFEMLLPINKEWRLKSDVDWGQDSLDTEKAMRELAKRKRK